jgi:RHS repeat-associated protein
VTLPGALNFGYDASGNTLYDGNNRYWYDGEGQLCAVQSLRWQGGTITQYIYDAEGARIGKGTLSAAPGGYTATCAPPLGAGFTLTARYLVDLAGDQVTELTEQGLPTPQTEQWAHSNVWAAGRLTATYDTLGVHYSLTDPLGTKRVQANALGQVDESCTSLPFGNEAGNPIGASCAPTPNSLGTAGDATEHHFTQKEHDNETGNDYFLARYYSSALGRFTTPDWSAKTDPVPYAVFTDPQSLNLYAYVRNNPLTRVDADGHIDCSGKNAAGVGCQAIAKWNADHGISPTAKKSDFPGVPVKLPDGKTVADAKSPTGQLMSPTSDLSGAAAKGKEIGATYQSILNSGMPGAQAAALAYLATALKNAVAQNGDFDYQRTILPGGNLQQLPQFRDVSNFNVGLIGAEAGIPLNTLLGIADGYARMRSSNGQNGLDPQTAAWETTGYQVGASGAYGH